MLEFCSLTAVVINIYVKAIYIYFGPNFGEAIFIPPF